MSHPKPLLFPLPRNPAQSRARRGHASLEFRHVLGKSRIIKPSESPKPREGGEALTKLGAESLGFRV